MEILLADTWMQDIGAKRDLYAAMGIREYWLYDPQSRCPRGEPRVQGFRLRGPSMRKSRRRCRARQTGPRSGAVVVQLGAADRVEAGCAGRIAPQ